MKCVVVGGVQSGSGKTTVALALMAAFARRGLRVQPFKVGPDYIDPGHHAAVAGRASHNLDGWMLPPDENRAVFARAAASADVAVVEGVMGLYDGVRPEADDASTARMAKDLDAPVLLVADARAQARTFAAVALGMRAFDPAVRWAGVVGNRVGSARHADILEAAMRSVPALAGGPVWLGGLPKNEALLLPQRHLGLVTAEERGWTPERIAALADWIEGALPLDRILAAADMPPPLAVSAGSYETFPANDGPVIAVARDAAFCFYYAENLRRLEAAGARFAFFSPLEDAALPESAAGLYLGGGYPELYAERLAANGACRAAVRRFVADGRPVHAECGGLMYLGRDVVDLEGRAWPMAEACEWTSRMGRERRALGYRAVRLRRACPLGPAGLEARGHEFHYSDIDPPADADLYEVFDGQGRASPAWAVGRGGLVASYVHLHFGSQPALADAFVQACRG